jgi:hypothetical protein
MHLTKVRGVVLALVTTATCALSTGVFTAAPADAKAMCAHVWTGGVELGPLCIDTPVRLGR